VIKPLQDAGLSILFAVIGFALLFLGYRVFDWMTPTSLNSDVFEKGNVAAAVLAGMFLIALAIVIHAAIS
jgi:putative membrane protein